MPYQTQLTQLLTKSIFGLVGILGGGAWKKCQGDQFIVNIYYRGTKSHSYFQIYQRDIHVKKIIHKFIYANWPKWYQCGSTTGYT